MNRLLRTLRCALVAGLAAGILPGCRPNDARGTIVVFNAGALALPIRQALDSFAVHNGLQSRQENAGSVETVRKITDLGRVPDVVALADTALFSTMLARKLASPVTVLGSTRLVLAYTARSRFASEVTPANWMEVTTRQGVEVGRSDPALDPAGYRALIAMQLAEAHYHRAGLAAALERAAGPRNIRPKSADLSALLQTGNLDYAWEYESVARLLGLRFISLPPEVNLGDPSLAAVYSTASTRIPLPSGGGALEIHGAPIVFGAAVPAAAHNPDAGKRFITYLVSTEGRRILLSSGLADVSAGQPSDTR